MSTSNLIKCYYLKLTVKKNCSMHVILNLWVYFIVKKITNCKRHVVFKIYNFILLLWGSKMHCYINLCRASGFHFIKIHRSTVKLQILASSYKMLSIIYPKTGVINHPRGQTHSHGSS